MFNEKIYSQKMDKTFDVFTKELTSLRTGRASSSMLDLIKVDVYGQKMPVNQLATVTTPDPRTIMTLGISCQEDQPGPFRFEIEYIKAVKEVADDTERYRRRLMRYGDGTTNDALIDNIRKKLK